MNNVLILLDNPDDWKPYCETKSILTVSDYLKNKPVEKDRKLVINLSNDYSYNSEGYYCSLLAQTRGQRVIPDVDIINKLETGTGIRMDRSLQALCYQWIQKNGIKSDIWYLNIYFGKCREKGLERVARFIFENYPCPLLRVALNTHPKNQIESIQFLPLNRLDDEEQDFFANTLDNFNKKIWRAPKSAKAPRYSLAVLIDPKEKFPPSNKGALHKLSEVAKKMKELDFFASIKRMDYDEAVEKGLITVMGAETDEKFLSNVMGQVNDKAAVEKVADTFKMVYTPFHGTGYKLIPEALRRLGMKHVICVPEQMVIDGNFPTVVSPNPENPEGFYLAVDLAKKEGADFILGSDPDADRVGIMVRTSDGEFKVLTGNQTGVLLLDYLIGAKQRTGKMPANPVALKTIVTTEMARKVAETNGLKCYDTFTGFKFLAEKKDKLENAGEGKVIFAYEESYGYMLGDYVRDKDAVTAALSLTEMAAWYAGQGMTLYDALLACYEKYGYYGEKTLNLVMPGLDGLKKMADLMANLRAQPPVEIAGVGVLQQKDYKDGSVVNVADGARSTMDLSGSNVLRYEMADGTSLIVRPSGTEPKVKVYILANGVTKAECDEKVAKYAAWAETLKG